MNEIINAKGNRYQSGYNAYSAMKKKWAGIISHAARNQEFEKISGGNFAFYFLEKDRRRDPSNFTSGGIKLIEDALQSASLLDGDGWRQVRSISVSWDVDRDCPGVFVIVDSLYRDRWEVERIVKGLLEGRDVSSE